MKHSRRAVESVSQHGGRGNALFSMASGENHALFVYGTLLDSAVRTRLLGRRLKAVPAILPGFEREQRKYFCIMRRRGAVTRGALVRGLTEADFRLLDAYEEVPRLYTRGRAKVLAEDGRPVKCFAYLPTSLGRR